jgi:hypothetical protein
MTTKYDHLVLQDDSNQMKTLKNGTIMGPLWLTRGERFRPVGADIFLKTRQKEYRNHLKSLKKERRAIRLVLKQEHNYCFSGSDASEDTASSDDADQEIIDKRYLSISLKELKVTYQVSTNQMERSDKSHRCTMI